MTHRDERIAIAVDDGTIVGTLFTPAGARAPAQGVLFVHGWGGHQEQYRDAARAIADLGCVCLTFDLRGHVDTHTRRDSVTREDNLRDVLAAYDVLASHAGVEKSRMALVGASYGAYLGALVLYKRAVQLLSLRAPALYKDEDWELPKRELHVDPNFAAYRRLTLRAEENRALGACAQFHGDVLIVESEHDEIVPHPAVANYIAAFANAHSMTYRVIEGADHALSERAWEVAYTELLVHWMKEMTVAIDTHRTAGLA